MIGWKAKYGYFPKSTPSNISELVVTDDSFYTIATEYNGFTPTYGKDATWNNNSLTTPYTSVGDAQTALANIFGDDFYTLYNYPWISGSSSTNGDYSAAAQLVPSSIKAVPNMLAMLKAGNSPSPGVGAVYIPSLKRVIFNGILIYSVLEDGSLLRLNELSPSLGHPPRFQNFLYRNGSDEFIVGANVILTAYDGTRESLINGPYCLVQWYVTGWTGLTERKAAILVNYFSNDSYTKAWFSALFNEFTQPDIDIPDNPYEPGGESGEGGGGGTFDDNSDPIPIPTIPTLSSSNTGFTRIYNPTLAQVQDLARYLWTDESVIQTIWNHIKQFFENPMDAIIGFNLVPVPVPDGGTQNFALMYIDTGVPMTVAASQFVDVDCGSLTIEPYYGSALDYSPYTKIACFLPFIGTVSLNVDEVMGRTLAVKYRVDICSGSCVAYITVDGNAIYQFSGHCAISIPLSQADFSSYVNAAISVAKLAGAAMLGAAGGGAAAAASEAAQTTSETTTITNTARNPSTGRQITTGTQVITSERTESTPVTKASFAGLTPQNVSNTVGEIMNAKPHIEHSGSFSGNSGYLGVRRPFVIIERPNMCMPANYQTLNGFPAMITMSLGSCKGYTRVQQVQLTGLHATNPEQAEILQLLKSGVIL